MKRILYLFILLFISNIYIHPQIVYYINQTFDKPYGDFKPFYDLCYDIKRSTGVSFVSFSEDRIREKLGTPLNIISKQVSGNIKALKKYFYNKAEFEFVKYDRPKDPGDYILLFCSLRSQKYLSNNQKTNIIFAKTTKQDIINYFGIPSYDNNNSITYLIGEKKSKDYSKLIFDFSNNKLNKIQFDAKYVLEYLQSWDFGKN